MLRWLLPIVAVLAVMGRSVTTFAAAGIYGDACCCPNPDTCKCHDHDAPPADPVMKRCGSEKQISISPTSFLAIAPAIETQPVSRVAAAVAHEIPELHDTFAPPPEKPPF